METPVGGPVRQGVTNFKSHHSGMETAVDGPDRSVTVRFKSHHSGMETFAVELDGDVGVTLNRTIVGWKLYHY